MPNRAIAALGTGLARLEAHMASRYAERSDGWPVGPELRGYRAWSCTSPTVQLVEMPRTGCPERFVVLTLFPFLRIDRRYRPSDPMRLHTARRYAFARLRTLSPDGEIVFSNKPGIELCRGGDHFGLEVRL